MDLKNLSHYRILDQIGSGGMGEVYLAEDTRLNRRVAIKVLTGDLSKDPTKVSRFEREAKAASALNHPNILTVYDVGKVDLTNYIVTEYVNGKTIRDYLRDGRFSVEKALSVVTDVAKALATAHEAGIIHRDIKPENIMIRNDGYVKILDFGLAKMVEIDFRENALVVTEPGQILGTPKYMSPEQIRGHEVDARTDIFSLGVVLYEMLTGVPPFDGSTVSDVIASVLRSEPQPVRELADDLPVAAENTVNRALAKEPDLRQRTMRQFLSEIEQTTGDGKARGQEASITLAMGRESGSFRGQDAETISPEAVPTPQHLAAQPSAKVVSTSYGSRRLFKYFAIGTAVAAAILLPLLINSAWWPWVTSMFVRKTAQVAAPPAKTMQIERVTTSGKVSEASISRDGKYIAYSVEDVNGKTSLWTRHVPTSRNVQIVPPAERTYQNLVISGDGNYIYYYNGEPKINGGEIHALPILGGTQRRIVERTNLGFAISPDDKQVLFYRFSDDQDEISVILANIDGSGERTIAVRRGGDFLDSPSFSPDGSRVAFVSGRVENQEVVQVGITEIGLSDLHATILSGQAWHSILALVYSPTGSSLLIAGKEQKDAPTQVWKISNPSGERFRVTNDLNNYSKISIGGESNDLLAIQALSTGGVLVAEGFNISDAKQITTGTGTDGQMGIAWTPDNRIIYTSRNGGSTDLWSMNLDGSDQRQLTANAAANVEPCVTGDGKFIVFSSNRSGSFQLWRMEIDGNNPVALTEHRGRFAQCSRDGNWIIYESHGNESAPLRSPTYIWKLSIQGGEAVKLTESPSAQPALSPDGNQVAYYSPDALSLISIDGGISRTIVKVDDRTFTMNWEYRDLTIRMPYFTWLPGGSGLMFASGRYEKQEFRQVLINDKTQKTVSPFDGVPSHYTFSPDGSRFAFRRHGNSSDVVRISNW